MMHNYRHEKTLYEYYPAGGSSLKINLLLAMGHAAESLMEATIRDESVEFFHKIAPFLHSGHIYPLLLCTPYPLPPKSDPQVFHLLQTTMIRGWGDYSV